MSDRLIMLGLRAHCLFERQAQALTKNVIFQIPKRHFFKNMNLFYRVNSNGAIALRGNNDFGFKQLSNYSETMGCYT
jgi:hypothetical protein